MPEGEDAFHLRNISAPSSSAGVQAFTMTHLLDLADTCVTGFRS